MERPSRSRRSVDAIPGTNARFLAKVPALAADEVFLDLEDGAAADQKERARAQVVDALRTLDFGSKTVAVRVNGTETPHYYRDLIAVVEQAGATLDAVIVPKVRTPGPRATRATSSRRELDGDHTGWGGSGPTRPRLNAQHALMPAWGR